MLKPLIVWITTNWKIIKVMGIPDHLTCLLRNLYAVQKATVRTGHGTTDWFQIRKGVRQGCIFHPAYLTYMQSTLCEMLGWMNQTLESILLGEISTTSDMQMLLLLSCFSRVWLCATPEMAAHQAPPSLGFSRQEHWSSCHFLLQCMKVKSESEVAQSCLTLSDPMDCSLPGSSVHGIFQARVLEWGAIAFSRYAYETTIKAKEKRN